MDGKADDGVHHLLGRDVDRQIVGRCQSLDGCHPVLGHQQSLNLIAPLRHQYVEHALAFGDEAAAVAVVEVAIAHVHERRNAGIIRLVDGDEHGRL